MERMKLNIQLFASGNITFATSGALQGKIDWTSTSNGSTANTSTVTARIYARKTTSVTTTGKSWNGNVNIGGNNHTYSQIYTGVSTSIGTSWVLIETFTNTITHDDNGSKTITISGSVSGPSGTSLEGVTSSGSGSAVLDTILRASTMTNDTLSTSRKDFNADVTFTITRAVNDFTHTLKYTVGGITTTIGTGIATSKVYAFPLSLITSFPNTTSPNIEVTIETYDDVDLIGTKTNTVYLNVPSTYIPSISLAINDPLVDTTGGVPSSWGAYIKSKSKIHAVLTEAGSSGSTILNRSTPVNGTTYTTAEFTTNVLTTVGSQDIVSTVTDSRGRQNTDTETINVIDYSAPTISSFKMIRCLSDGTPSNNGTYAKAQITYSISPCNNGTTNLNDKILKAICNSQTKTITLSNYSGTVYSDVISGISTSTAYNATAYIGDTFYPSGSELKFTAVIGTSVKILSIYNDETGISFGEVATESNKASFALAAKFKENVLFEKDLYAEGKVSVGGAYDTELGGQLQLLGKYKVSDVNSHAKIEDTPINIINNLTTASAGLGMLDAYQGKVLNDNFSDSGWIELNTVIKYRKKNGVVYFNGYSNNTTGLTANDYKTVGTLPTGYRPTIEEVNFSVDAMSGDAKNMTAKIGTDGNIRIYSTSTTAYWRCNGSFPV